VKDELMKAYKMKDLGELSWFLGLRISRDRSARTLTLDQQPYIDAILERFGMTNCKSCPTPLAVGVTLSKADSPQTAEEASAVNSVPYREAVGALMYAMTATRPDIATAVGMVSRFNSCFGMAHWKAVKRILRYLRGTAKRGITFTGSDEQPTLCGFSDAAYADNVDNRRSTSGWLFLLCGAPIAWKSAVQRCVSLSTCESEYIALSLATRECVWLRQLLSDLGFVQPPTVLYEDNQGAIALASNAMVNQRSKHIDIRYHYVRQMVQRGTVTIVYCRTEEMLADILTKALHAQRFAYLCSRLMD
jgi:hypothetical protein